MLATNSKAITGGCRSYRENGVIDRLKAEDRVMEGGLLKREDVVLPHGPEPWMGWDGRKWEWGRGEGLRVHRQPPPEP